MPPINEILQFGHAGTEENGDVLSPEDYAADPQRAAGHQEGMARRELMNITLRQAMHMAAGLAQFIAENYEPGVVDDGDLAKVVAGLQAILDAKADTLHDHDTEYLGITSQAADSDKLDGMQPATAATASTIAQRDINGDLVARYFFGTATSARYA